GLQPYPLCPQYWNFKNSSCLLKQFKIPTYFRPAGPKVFNPRRGFSSCFERLRFCENDIEFIGCIIKVECCSFYFVRHVNGSKICVCCWPLEIYLHSTSNFGLRLSNLSSDFYFQQSNLWKN